MKNKPMREKRRRRITFGAALSGFVFITLVASCVYSIIHIIITPPGAIAETQYDKLKSDYVLMLLQCILGLIVIAPSLVQDRRCTSGGRSRQTLPYSRASTLRR